MTQCKPTRDPISEIIRELQEETLFQDAVLYVCEQWTVFWGTMGASHFDAVMEVLVAAEDHHIDLTMKPRLGGQTKEKN